MVNQLAISRNEDRYPRPEAFRPERWLEPTWPTYKEPLSQHPDIRGDAAFGEGQRACPGQELARTEIYTLLSGVAWAFNVRLKAGWTAPWYETSPWIITMSNSFPLEFEVRSEQKGEILRSLDVSSVETSRYAGDAFGDWQGLARRTDVPSDT
jgi:hypothetical protein